MRVGNLDIELPVLLAPMAAVTDLPFRTVCEEFGLGITITEFLSADAILAGDSKTTEKMTPSLAGRPFGVQIFGRTDAPMRAAAKMAVDMGASLVDINMGCPAKRVVAGACGSALMKEAKLAAHIVRTIVETVPHNVPVTVKHRAGWDNLHRNAPEFAGQMVEAGAQMITVHGRTRSQGYGGRSDNQIIAAVRAAVPPHIPVVGNGDVTTPDDYMRMREETGCDAVMIGRGALGNPWLFRSIRARLNALPDPGAPDMGERIRVFNRHINLILELKNGPKVIHEVRKACAWYAKGLYGGSKLRQTIWKINDPQSVYQTTLDYFTGLRERPAA